MFVFSIHIGFFCKYIILTKGQYFQIKTDTRTVEKKWQKDNYRTLISIIVNERKVQIE